MPPPRGIGGAGPIAAGTNPPPRGIGGAGPIAVTAKPPPRGIGGAGPIAVATTPPPRGIGGAGPIAVSTTPPPRGIGGAGPIAVATTPPPRGIGGAGPIAVAQNPGAERLEAESTAACAAVMFRIPIAPVSTNKTRASTVRHFDMSPPEGKLTRGEYMYFRSLMEQKSYIVSKRSTPLDNVPVGKARRPNRDSSSTHCPLLI